MVFSPLERGLASKRNRWRFARLLPLTCLLSSSFVACDDDVDSAALPGELGSNQFFYGCSSLDDVQCREELTSFPDFVAVGARFELNASRDLGSSLFIKPASPSLVSAAVGEFEFLEPGISAFLALDDNEELKDFIHLEAVPVDEIQVEGSFGQRVSEVTLEAGRELTLVAVPMGDDEELAGSLSFRWETEDERVVQVPRRGTEIRLEARQEGRALVRVELDDVETTIEVNVTKAGVEPRDAGEEPDRSTDASALDGAVDAGPGLLDAGEMSSAPSNDHAGTDAGSTTSSDSTSSDQSPATDASAPMDAAVSSDAQAPTEAGDQ